MIDIINGIQSFLTTNFINFYKKKSKFKNNPPSSATYKYSQFPPYPFAPKIVSRYSIKKWQEQNFKKSHMENKKLKFMEMYWKQYYHACHSSIWFRPLVFPSRGAPPWPPHSAASKSRSHG